MANAFVAAFEILSFGAIIVLIVLGLGIIASMMGIFNFAQGEFVLLGAYITYLAYAKGMPIWAGMVAAPFLVGALGFVLEALIIRRFYAAPIVAMHSALTMRGMQGPQRTKSISSVRLLERGLHPTWHAPTNAARHRASHRR